MTTKHEARVKAEVAEARTHMYASVTVLVAVIATCWYFIGLHPATIIAVYLAITFIGFLLLKQNHSYSYAEWLPHFFNKPWLWRSEYIFNAINQIDDESLSRLPERSWIRIGSNAVVLKDADTAMTLRLMLE